MILRRLTEHVKAQNWFAVAIDFFIVVIGVFIGIQVSNWNAARIESRRAAVVLDRLVDDYRQMEVTAKMNAETLLDRAAAVDRVIAFLKSDGPVPDNPEQFFADLDAVMLGINPIERSATFVELLASGETTLIRDDRLRAVLVRNDLEHQGALRAYEVINEFWIRYGETIGRKLVLSTTMSEDGNSVFTTVASYDLAALRGDPEVIPALSVVRRMHIFNARWRSGIARAAADSLSRLEADV